MSAPLFQKIESYIKQDVYPFHMPGHKGINISAADFFKMDITELPQFDNLHNPSGVIQKAQQLAAEAFGADKSFFLVNGASSGIIAAILTCVRENEKIICGRNAHVSAYNGVILSGAVPVYVSPRLFSEYHFFGGLSAAQIENALAGHPDAKAVLITSPTYEGFTTDIAAIAAAVHKRGKILIVDEAHGAHFAFHDSFPRTALSQGADIVIQSLHKTLPAISQSAILHVKGSRIDLQRLSAALSIMQTTSPSYGIMSLMDYVRDFLTGKGKDYFSAYIARIMAFREEMASCKTVQLLGKEIVGQNFVHDVDIGKLLFALHTKDVTPKELQKILYERYKIQMEMTGVNSILAITSIMDQQKGFDALRYGMQELNRQLFFCKEQKELLPVMSFQTILPPRRALFHPSKTVKTKDAKGKTAAEFFTIYPPGIPLLVPGELITQPLIDIMKAENKHTIAVLQ